MHRSLIAVALLLLTPLANAQVYKWTDASGTVHYSQDAPPQGTKYKQVTTTGTVVPPASSASASNTASASQPASAATSSAAAGATVNNSKYCVTLKANLTALQGSGPVVMQQDGKSTALDDSQRKQQALTTQTQYTQYCLSQ